MQSSFVLLKSEQISERLQSPSGEFRLLLQECKSRAPCPVQKQLPGRWREKKTRVWLWLAVVGKEPHLSAAEQKDFFRK